MRMLRFGPKIAITLCTLGLIATPLTATAQDWQDQGSIESREYKNEIREGNQVTATEFFHLVYSVSVQIKEAGKSWDTLICRNECKGKKHKEHKECDFSCDNKCSTPHKITEEGYYEPYTDQMRAATQAANQLAIRGGGTVSPDDWSHRVSQALANFRRECRKKKTFNMPHLDKPCGGKLWEVGAKNYNFVVRGTMRKVGFRMSRGVRTPIDEEVGSHEQTVAYGEIVQDEPFDKREWTACNCKFVPEENPKSYIHDWFGGGDPVTDDFIKWLEDLINILDGLLITDPKGNPVPRDGVDVGCTGNDMNNGEVVCTNNTDQPVVIHIIPGVFFWPDDPLVQLMAAMQGMQLQVEPLSTATLRLSLDPGLDSAGQAKGKFRWACMEMAKHEPNSKVKFKPKSPIDPNLAALGRITNRSRFRGPWDQARVWIYTDKATLDQVNKRMLPPIDAGRYLMLLRDNAQAAGVDFSEKGYVDCLQPDLLARGVCVDQKAVRWAIGAMANIKPRDLEKYVNSQVSKFAELANKDPEDGPKHVAWVASAMLESGDEGLQKAACKLLLAMPQAARPGVDKAGGLEGLRSLFAGLNEASCNLALDVVEAYGVGAEAKQMVMAYSERLPGDALKARVAKMIAGE